MGHRQKSWLFWRSGAARLPSLRACLAGVILLVLLPTLVVVAIAIINAGESYRSGSMSRLRETADVVAQAVEGELESAVHRIRAYALMIDAGDERESHRQWLAQSFGDGTFHRIILQKSGEDFAILSQSADPEIAELARKAARTGLPQLSNLMTGSAGRTPCVAMAIANPANRDGMVEADVVVMRPEALTRTLTKQGASRQSVTLAVTDGSGHIIGRSRDVDRFMGRPVPDWQTLIALGTDSGSFEARTIEGQEIIFAFRKIEGTPGWVAVVGEPLSLFNGRWQKPIAVMATASAATIAFASLLAWILARNILRPIRLLVAHTERVASTRGEGEAVEVPPSFVAEFEALRLGLAASEAELRGSIAESRAAEQTAEKSLAAMRRAERLARIGSWSLNLETLEFSCSEMLYILNGADPNGPPVTLGDLRRLTSPETFERIRTAIDQCVATGEPYSLEITHLREDGSHFPALLRGGPVYGDGGVMIGLAGTVQDVSERQEQMTRLAMLADNLPSGAILRLERDASGRLRVSYVSAGVEAMTGITPAELVDDRESILRLIHLDDRPGYETALAAFIAEGGAFHHEFRLTTLDGRVIWLRVRAARHVLLDGRIVWDGIMLDITDEKASAQALEAAKEAAESAERAKGDFLATMSHEIRTPMNAVIGMTRLTLQTDLTAKQRNYLSKIDVSARILLGIINDVLDFSRIEAGGLAMEQTEFTIESVLESVSALTAMRAEEKHLEVIFAVAPDVPQAIVGDPLRLGQVLTNLVSNAIKFTAEGEIAVTVERVADMATPMLRFSVRDTGIGLDAGQIARLFRPFSQAERATSRKYGGTGLGLAISKRLVGMMGGEISVTSEPGQGATFVFTIAARPAGEPRAMLPNLGGRSVLIVDDNESARTALADMVSSLGLEVSTRDSGMAALALLHERALAGQPFDVVLMDWRMPQLDGLETARRMRSDAAIAKMPAVLMVTAYGREEILRGADDVGLQGVLIKPVTHSVMYNTLMDLMVPSDGQDVLAQPVPVPDAEHLIAVLAGKRVLLADDNALNREVATDFLTAAGIKVQTAVNGVEALEKLAAGEFDAVLLDIHMPVMGGLEAARTIRRDPRWRGLPVISLTAQASPQDRDASLEAGMTAHLTKPIDEYALYRTLIEVFTGDGVESLTPPAHWQSSHAPEDVFNLSAVLRRFGGNRDRVQRLLDGFVRDFATAPAELDRLVAADDADGVAMLAHQLKGSAGYLDALFFVMLAAEVEEETRQHKTVQPSELTRTFRARLVDLLAAVVDASASLGGKGALDNTADVQKLILAAKPLVERGDYAALSLLEKIGACHSGGEGEALAKKAQALFEDLELMAALDVLADLERLAGGDAEVAE